MVVSEEALPRVPSQQPRGARVTPVCSSPSPDCGCHVRWRGRRRSDTRTRFSDRRPSTGSNHRCRPTPSVHCPWLSVREHLSWSQGGFLGKDASIPCGLLGPEFRQMSIGTGAKLMATWEIMTDAGLDVDRDWAGDRRSYVSGEQAVNVLALEFRLKATVAFRTRRLRPCGRRWLGFGHQRGMAEAWLVGLSRHRDECWSSPQLLNRDTGWTREVTRSRITDLGADLVGVFDPGVSATVPTRFGGVGDASGDDITRVGAIQNGRYDVSQRVAGRRDGSI